MSDDMDAALRNLRPSDWARVKKSFGLPAPLCRFGPAAYEIHYPPIVSRPDREPRRDTARRWGRRAYLWLRLHLTRFWRRHVADWRD